jgi:uncharacterized membrane protein YdbT with pleckstrin-like domain
MKLSSTETRIGEWRRSRWSLSFWVRTIATLGIYYFFLWRRNQITLTDKRVVQRTGNIIGGDEMSITIGNITNMAIKKSVMGAILDFADIKIDSAGGDEAQILFKNLGRAESLRDAIYSQQNTQQAQAKKAP